MRAPLEGVTVVEVASWVAVPSCGALLADLGASVVKVEPLTGDGMRGKIRQPAWPEGVDPTDVVFQLDNRGKRGIAVDLAADDGRAVVHRLAGAADVFLTNLTPGRARRFGLDPDTMRGVNGRLVYGTVTGSGTESEDADRLSFDLTAFFARGGLMSLIGEPDDPPHQFRPGQGDHATGLALLAAVLAALRVRDATGEFQFVETALFRVATWTIGCDMAAALVDERQPGRRARDQAISPMNTRYRCADDVWVNLSAHTQALWPAFCEAMERPDLATDERYDDVAKRFRAGPELVVVFDEAFASAPYDHWGPRLDAAGIAFNRVATLPDVVADPAAARNGMFTEVDHPSAGRFRTLAAPFRLHGADVAVRGPAPDPGQHSREVLADAGFGGDEIERLLAAGTVGGDAP